MSETRTASTTNVIIKCGDCLHLNNSAHPSKGTVCKNLGIKKFANAPSCFTPNIHVFKSISSNAVSQLGQLISSMNGTQSRVLLGLLRQQSKLHRKGFSFLSRIFFRLGSGYLDSYYSGYVFGVAPQGEILIVGESYITNQTSYIVAQLDADSVLKEEEFRKIEADLLSKGRVYSPKNPARLQVQARVDYETPTFDTSPEVLEKLAKASTKRAKTAPSKTVLEVDLSDLA